MALLHRETISGSEYKDQISIFSTQTWECGITFPLRTVNALSVQWSPRDAYLVVSDHPLHGKVFIYALDGTEIYCLDQVSLMFSIHFDR